MSVINSNAFAGALASGPTIPEFENDPLPQAAVARPAWQRTDDIATSPWGAPPAAAAAAVPDVSAAPQTSWNYSSVMNDFMAALSSLLGALGSAFGTTGTASATPSLPTLPAPAPAPGTAGTSETFYANATAESIGDPHDGFEGSNASGARYQSHWDNMSGHADLLDSDSFAGGYRLSTTATQPNASGITLNKSAAIATNSGATCVTLNGDGSYAVVSNGRNVSLQQGVATSLGNGESVTLGADGSLTVSDTNAAGGSLTTTLSRNSAGGVDVHSVAKNVDLGGYLATGQAAPGTVGQAPTTPTAPSPPAPPGPGAPPWPVPLSSLNQAGESSSDPFGIQAL
jgi:hypothetical protein